MVLVFVMFMNFVVVGIVGVSILLIFKKMKIDLVFVGSVVLIIVIDIVGIFVFLGIVIWLLI